MHKADLPIMQNMAQGAYIARQVGRVATANAGQGYVLCPDMAQMGLQPTAAADHQGAAPCAGYGIGYFQCAPLNPALVQGWKNLKDGRRGGGSVHAL